MPNLCVGVERTGRKERIERYRVMTAETRLGYKNSSSRGRFADVSNSFPMIGTANRPQIWMALKLPSLRDQRTSFAAELSGRAHVFTLEALDRKAPQSDEPAKRDVALARQTCTPACTVAIADCDL